MDLLREGQKITIFFQKNASMVEMSCEIEKFMMTGFGFSFTSIFPGRYIECLQVGFKLTAKSFLNLEP